jgi:hypothetical protein
MADSTMDSNIELKCRFCGGVSAVPGSTCPHCGREVMALCPQCKRYVDNQLEACDRCGTPLAAMRQVAHGLSATGAQAATDTSLPPPPRALSDAYLRAILVQPAALSAIVIATFVFIEAALTRGAANDPSGILTALAAAAVLYPAAALFAAWRMVDIRTGLLRGGVAVRGRLVRVEGRRAEHRLMQVVEFRFVDLRGQERSSIMTPFGSLEDLAAGTEVTVLYMPDEPGKCSVYPFVL